MGRTEAEPRDQPVPGQSLGTRVVPEPHPQPLETSLNAHWLALGIALLWPSVATYAYFVLLSGDEAMSLVYGVAKVLQFAFPLVWVLAVQKRRLQLERPTSTALIWGFSLGLCLVAAGLVAYYGCFKGSRLLADTPARIAAKLSDMGLTTPGRYWSFALFLAMPHALLEEYYWRWFVFGQSRRVMPLRWAVLLSSLGFMAHHVLVIYQYMAGSWGMTLFLSLCVATGGGLWALLYHRQRSIYAPWISHFMMDCVIMYIGYDLAMR